LTSGGPSGDQGGSGSGSGSVGVERWLGRRRASDCEVASGGGSHHTQLKVQSVPEHPPPDRALARFAEISPPSPSSQSGPHCRLSGQLGLDVATRCNFNAVYPSHQRFNSLHPRLILAYCRLLTPERASLVIITGSVRPHCSIWKCILSVAIEYCSL
jgi:hypothetical protein